MKIFLLIVLVVASLWDGFTTVYGTVQILGNAPIQLGASILFAALIFGFVLNTKRIMAWQSGFVSAITKMFWVIALGYDLFTSWVGNNALVVGGQDTTTELIILLGLTLLVTASPILLSAFWQSGSLVKSEQESPPYQATGSESV